MGLGPVAEDPHAGRPHPRLSRAVPDPFPRLPSPPLRRLILAGAALVSVLVAGLAVALAPDTRSAWEEAPLTRGRRPPEDPVTLSLWANALGPLLREAEALGPAPRHGKGLLRWMAAQCAITRRIQDLQRRSGRAVESPAQLGRLPYCEDLPLVEKRLAERDGQPVAEDPRP